MSQAYVQHCMHVGIPWVEPALEARDADACSPLALKPLLSPAPTLLYMAEPVQTYVSNDGKETSVETPALVPNMVEETSEPPALVPKTGEETHPEPPAHVPETVETNAELPAHVPETKEAAPPPVTEPLSASTGAMKDTPSSRTGAYLKSVGNSRRTSAETIQAALLAMKPGACGQDELMAELLNLHRAVHAQHQQPNEATKDTSEKVPAAEPALVLAPAPSIAEAATIPADTGLLPPQSPAMLTGYPAAEGSGEERLGWGVTLHVDLPPADTKPPAAAPAAVKAVPSMPEPTPKAAPPPVVAPSPVEPVAPAAVKAEKTMPDPIPKAAPPPVVDPSPVEAMEPTAATPPAEIAVPFADAVVPTTAPDVQAQLDALRPGQRSNWLLFVLKFNM